MESSYCKICILYSSCQKDKRCSCALFETNISLKVERKQKNY